MVLMSNKLKAANSIALVLLMQMSLIGCTVNGASVDTLQPYPDGTLSSGTSESNVIAYKTNTPAPTPTQAIYLVKENDTIIGIAKKLELTPEALLLANPDVVPAALSVGQKLLLPGQPNEAANPYLPTPVPLQLGTPICDAQPDGSECFVEVNNQTQQPIENIIVRFYLFGPNGAEIMNVDGVLLLNQLQPNQSLPASVFLLGQPKPFHVEAFLTSANPASSQIADPKSDMIDVTSTIAWDGKTATVNGLLVNPAGFDASRMVWIAAVGVDKDGKTNAYRRWEWSGKLKPNEQIPFQLDLASHNGAIVGIQVLLEEWPESKTP